MSAVIGVASPVNGITSPFPIAAVNSGTTSSHTTSVVKDHDDSGLVDHLDGKPQDITTAVVAAARALQTVESSDSEPSDASRRETPRGARTPAGRGDTPQGLELPLGSVDVSQLQHVMRGHGGDESPRIQVKHLRKESSSDEMDMGKVEASATQAAEFVTKYIAELAAKKRVIDVMKMHVTIEPKAIASDQLDRFKDYMKMAFVGKLTGLSRFFVNIAPASGTNPLGARVDALIAVAMKQAGLSFKLEAPPLFQLLITRANTTVVLASPVTGPKSSSDHEDYKEPVARPGSSLSSPRTSHQSLPPPALPVLDRRKSFGTGTLPLLGRVPEEHPKPFSALPLPFQGRGLPKNPPAPNS